ncbi:MAG: glycosyltransferase family 4 protein [Bacteroidota bacterium]
MSDKIAIVSHSYPTASDPSYGIFIKREAALIRNFAEPIIFVPQVLSTPLNRQYYRTKNLVDDGIKKEVFKYISFPSKYFPSLITRSLSRQLLKKLKLHDPSLIHLHWLYPQGLTVSSLKRNDFKVVITIHGGDWYSNIDNEVLFPLIQKSLTKTDAIVCVGEKLKEHILQEFPEFSKKTHHIPHSIDTTRFIPTHSRTELRNALGWSVNKLHLLCVANFHIYKGVDLLVRSLPKVHNLENVHLHLVAPRREKEMGREIKSIINEKKLQNHISLYGSLDEAELIQFMQAADLFVSPSLKEGFGIVCAEAIACGVPVLSTTSGGPEEILSEETGLLIPTGDVDALANGINTLLENRNQFHPDNLHESILRRYGKGTKTERLKKLYSSLIP